MKHSDCYKETANVNDAKQDALPSHWSWRSGYRIRYPAEPALRVLVPFVLLIARLRLGINIHYGLRMRLSSDIAENRASSIQVLANRYLLCATPFSQSLFLFNVDVFL